MTLNKPTGAITLNGDVLAGASVSFTLTNSLIDPRYQLITTLRGTAGAYRAEVGEIAAAGGSCMVRLTNVLGASLTEAPLLNVMLLKGAQF